MTDTLTAPRPHHMYARQAIATKYLPPTNFRPARIKVSCQSGSAVYPWDHGCSPDKNHGAAALFYAKSRGWDTDGCILAPLHEGREYILALRNERQAHDD